MLTVLSAPVGLTDLYVVVDSPACQPGTAAFGFQQSGKTTAFITLATTTALVSLAAGSHVLRFCVGGGKLFLYSNW